MDHNREKTMLHSIGMDYNTHHACPNDCILYRHEYNNAVQCPHCGTSRYRQDVQGERVPAKVLRHFPIIPRIKTMFKCKSIARMMT